MFSLLANRLPTDPDDLKKDAKSGPEMDPPPPDSFFFAPKNRPNSFLGPGASSPPLFALSAEWADRMDWREKTVSRLCRPTLESTGRGMYLLDGEGCVDDEGDVTDGQCSYGSR